MEAVVGRYSGLRAGFAEADGPQGNGIAVSDDRRGQGGDLVNLADRFEEVGEVDRTLRPERFPGFGTRK